MTSILQKDINTQLQHSHHLQSTTRARKILMPHLALIICNISIHIHMDGVMLFRVGVSTRNLSTSTSTSLSTSTSTVKCVSTSTSTVV